LNKIKPDLELPDEDALSAAQLLLTGCPEPAGKKKGYLRLEVGPNVFFIDPRKQVNEENWESYASLINSISKSNIKIGRNNGWQAFSANDSNYRWKCYYPGYSKLGSLNNINASSAFLIKLPAKIDPKSLSEQAFQLIEADTGIQTGVTIKYSGKKAIIKPEEALKPGSRYWLLLNEKAGLYEINVRNDSTTS